MSYPLKPPGYSESWSAAPRRPQATAAVRAAVTAFAFLYLLIIRTEGITGSFYLLGDQIRDWSIALGGWRNLPLTGTPTTAGGTTLGPTFYWILWAIRHAIGPWTSNLPHAGGIGISIVQSTADVLLLNALWRRTNSSWIAIAVTLIVGTASFEMALSALIWNPPVASALIKTTIALVLIADERPSMVYVAATTAVAWLAVQTHSMAMFVAAPAIAAFPLREFAMRRWARGCQQLRTAIEVIVLLQIPFFINMTRRSAAAAGPGRLAESVMYTLEHPASLRVRESFDGLAAACRGLLVSPWAIPGLEIILAGSMMAVAYRLRRDLMLLFVTIVPLLAVTAAFAFWQQLYDPYWYLPLMPSVALTVVLALTSWQPIARPAAVILLVVVVAAQPGRFTHSRLIFRMPEYRPLLLGSREILRHTNEIRRIDTDFSLPPTADSEYLFRVLGGRVTRDAAFRATIGREGGVTFKPADR